MIPNEENQWVEVRDPYTRKLICRYRPGRLLLEVRKGKRRTIVDLRQYEEDKDDDRD